MFYDKNNAMIRRKIYDGIASLAMEGNLKYGLEELAGELMPDVSEVIPGRDDSVVRRVIKSRISSALNINFNKDASYYEMAEESMSEGNNPPLITVFEDACNHERDGVRPCKEACIADALKVEVGKVYIDDKKCIGCGLCTVACPTGAITDKADIVKVVGMLKDKSTPTYAVLAPAFAGQFDADEEQVKAGLLTLGFSDVAEVALGADVITVREAEEFITRMERGDKFMITSCCCPPFFTLVEKYKPEMSYMISDSVSPMISIGRMLKTEYPGCRVVFIGPCIAKKNEAKKPELKDAVDAVLTFEETSGFFKSLGVNLKQFHKSNINDASHDGRSYGHTGGVTGAIISSIRRLRPDIDVKTAQGNGIKECRAILDKASEESLDANFVEGMACVGGCVGGPGRILNPEIGKRFVEEFADEADVKEAIVNPKAREFVKKFGYKVKLYSKKG